MLSIDELDRLLARSLKPSAASLKYARWIQARGREQTSIGEVFVEIGMHSADEVERALEPWMAELDPRDVQRAVGRYTPPKGSPPPSMRSLADAHQKDSAVVKLANMLLVGRASQREGAAFRVEKLRVMSWIVGEAEELVVEARAGVLEQVVRRLQIMTGESDAIRLIVRDVPRDIAFEVVKTDRGSVALARRVLPWPGSQWPTEARFRPWRDAMTKRAFGVAVDAARAIGDDAVIEETLASAEQAQGLLEAGRDDEARPLAERARDLAMEHIPAPSARAWLGLLFAATRGDVPAARFDLTMTALSFVRAMPFTFGFARATEFARLAGRASDAIRLAAETEQDSMQWYGGANEHVLQAFFHAGHAELDLGDVASAHARVTQMNELARAIGVPDAAAYATWLEGRTLDRAGDHAGALDRLRSAREAIADDVELEAHIAVALAGAGNMREASESARVILARLRPSDAHVARWLEPLTTRSGPFR